MNRNTQPAILHILCQRPGMTGSGVFLQNLARQANRPGIRQGAVIGVDASEQSDIDLEIDPSDLFPVLFNSQDLPFPIPGMSDEMPYESTRFSSLTNDQFERYCGEFRSQILSAVEHLRPTVIWAHHLWISTAVSVTACPAIPHVGLCHGTDLRQMALAPMWADYARRGCRSIDFVAALTAVQAQEIEKQYGISQDRIHVTGGGYRDDLFTLPTRETRSLDRIEVTYVGKLSRAKGVDCLLDAFGQVLHRVDIPTVLNLVGGGAGQEYESLIANARSLAPHIRVIGPLPQEDLAAVLARSHVLVLPSFYEGLGLIVIEALASGCRVVATDLPALRSVLPQEAFETGIVRLVPLPRLAGPDTPLDEDIPKFVSRLAATVQAQIKDARTDGEKEWQAASRIAQPFTWKALFDRLPLGHPIP